MLEKERKAVKTHCCPNKRHTIRVLTFIRMCFGLAKKKKEKENLCKTLLFLWSHIMTEKRLNPLLLWKDSKETVIPRNINNYWCIKHLNFQPLPTPKFPDSLSVKIYKDFRFFMTHSFAGLIASPPLSLASSSFFSGLLFYSICCHFSESVLFLVLNDLFCSDILSLLPFPMFSKHIKYSSLLFCSLFSSCSCSTPFLWSSGW